MEPGSGEVSSHEPAEVNVDSLISNITSGVRAHLFDEKTVTYRNAVDGIGRDCFLAAPDNSAFLAFSYGSHNLLDKPVTHVEITIIDKSTAPQSGYRIIVDPDNEALMDFHSDLPNFIEDGYGENKFEAVYGVDFDRPKYDFKQNTPQNLQRGLVRVNELLKTTHPDIEATQRLKAWLVDTHNGSVISNLDEINAILPGVDAGIDTALSIFPSLVNKAFSKEGLHPQSDED